MIHVRVQKPFLIAFEIGSEFKSVATIPSPPLFERLSILGLNNLLAVTLLAPTLTISDDHKNTLEMTMVFV